MSLWKKVGGAVLSTTLTASLLLTVAGSAAAATPPLTCSVAIDTTVCSQVADGHSIVTVAGAVFVTGAGNTLTVTSNGVLFTAKAGNFTIATNGLSASLPAGTSLAVTDKLTLTAPSAAGTTILDVTVASAPDPATGQVTITDLGTFTITWLASSNLGVSIANSTIKVVANGGTCASDALTSPNLDRLSATPLVLCVKVLDGNGNAVANTANVSVSITPVGLIGTDPTAAGTGQAASKNTASGIALFGISGSGLVGTGTIAVSVTYNGTTTALGTASVVFSGPVASIIATNNKFAIPNSGATGDVVRFTAKDSGGNLVGTAGATAVSSDTTVLTTGAVVNYVPSPLTNGSVTLTCLKEGSATVTIKQVVGAATIASNAVKVFCSDVVDTYTVAFDKTTVVPGGSATLTVTAKDASGQPAVDGSATPSASLVSAGALGTWSTVKNGVTTATYLAPFNTGVVTVLVTMAATTTVGPVSASLKVSAPAPIPGAVTFAPTTSALGNTLVGPFTFATKIQAIGGFITWKVDGGSALAGQTIQIWVYKKFSATGTWAGPTMLTTRKANASGVAYVNIHTGGILWLSLRPVVPATDTTAAVWGPTSIGRWR